MDSNSWKVKGLRGSFGKRYVVRGEQEWWKEWQGKRMKDERSGDDERIRTWERERNKKFNL